MGRRIVVVASGRTEQAALGHLLRDVLSEGVELLDIVVPPRHRKLDLAMATSLIRVQWYSRLPENRPDKFVVLVDADRSSPGEVTAPFAAFVERSPVDAAVLVCAAKWHLEAWFFADARALRDAIGRDLGRVVEAVPDDIEDPKRRLKRLLDGIYTAQVAGRIARELRTSELAKSPSFTAFEAAVRNGGGHGPSTGPA